EEGGGGVRDLVEPTLPHLEHRHLVGRAEPVLDGAQHPQRMRAVSLEVEDGVDQVLEHARAGERALLGHVADEKAGDAARLRARDEPAAKHAVQLRETGRTAERRTGGDGGERPRFLAARRAGAGAARAWLGERLLDHRAPRAATRALPEPARGRMAALLAHEG